MERFKWQDRTPYHIVKVTTEIEEQARNLLRNDLKQKFVTKI